MAKPGKKEAVSKPAPLFAIRFCIGLLAFFLYSNTLSHKFTLDDDFFFLKNKAVAKGVSSIGSFFTEGSLEGFSDKEGLQPYRPVTLLSFAIQKEMTGFKLGPAHFVNVLLFSFLCILLFNLLLKIFPRSSVWIPVVITSLFLFHPIHTEVVASIKSRDELLSALFGVWALSIFFGNKLEIRSWTRIACSAFLFALAIFSKEGAVALLAIFPLVSLVLNNEKIKRVAVQLSPLILITALFLFMRNNAVGSALTEKKADIINNILYGTNGFAESFATRMEILWVYLGLLFVPINLSWDYSFNQIPVIDFSSPIAWISLVVHLAMIVFAIKMYKKKSEITFGILFYLITLAPVSNIFFLFGATLAERFLFLPSIGFCIAIGFALPLVFKINVSTFKGENKTKLIGTVAAVCLLFGVMTHNRNKDWESNLTILEAGAISSPNSARAHSALAAQYRIQGETSSDGRVRSENFKNAIAEFKEALRILPENSFSLYNLGLTYQMTGDTVNAMKTYQTTLHYAPEHEFALNNLGALYENIHRSDSAIYFLSRLVKAKPEKILYKENLAIFHLHAGNNETAIVLSQEIISVQPSNKKAFIILSEAYRNSGDQIQFAKYQELANQLR